MQDPLWDNQACRGEEEECCNVPGLPWFHKVLESSKTDSIELRVCGNEGTTTEDVLLSQYEIYVK